VLSTENCDQGNGRGYHPQSALVHERDELERSERTLATTQNEPFTTQFRDTGDRCDPVFGFFAISLLYGEQVKSASHTSHVSPLGVVLPLTHPLVDELLSHPLVGKPVNQSSLPTITDNSPDPSGNGHSDSVLH